MRRLGFACVVTLLACGSSSPPAPPPAPTSPADFTSGLNDSPRSCVFDCDPTCNEAHAPWKCPALADYASIPHADACGAFDGKTFPAPAAGKCAATSPSGDALAKTTLTGTPMILPDGRRLVPAGTEWLFREPDMPGGFPSSALLVPGTKWLLVADTGYDMHSVRAIDTTVLRAGGTQTPVVSSVKFPQPKALNWGMAYVAASNVLYVASGTPDSKIYAFDLDVATGKLTQDDAKTVTLANAFPQGVAVSADGKTLLVGQATDSKLLVVGVAAGATYGQLQASIDVGSPDVFAVKVDPNDPTGNTAYASLWRGIVSPSDTAEMRVVQIDIAKRTATPIVVGKTPEDFVFLDGRYMVVANALSDTLSIVDRVAGKVASTVALSTTHGVEPTTLAYDKTNRRLYATLSSANAVAAFDVDVLQSPPLLTPAGTFSTAWWPTSVTVDPTDGALYVTNGKGHGTGTDGKPRALNIGFPAALMTGSVEAVPFLDGAGIATATATQKQATAVQQIAGYPTVQCNGAPYDFPIPQDTASGPSAAIKHVFFIVRENKTFDDIFGDVPGVDGDPSFAMAPGHMDEIWPNARAIGGAFSHLDNFYEDAEQSIQGHTWTVFGRSTDYDERRWLIIWGRGELGVTSVPGIGDDTAPVEGSIFASLVAQGVKVENMGELVNGLGAYRDTHWPGGTTSSADTPDSPAACYLAARARVLCNVADFTYVWLSNDHAFGNEPGKPNPALMVAENDEATGILLDGISHSPLWASSLVVVVEDDPQDGGDHVDQHRSIALFASPWIKRKYVSHAHYDMASVHKVFSHVFGKPYRNEVIANAPLPLDLFTATPDYTPYDYIPRRWSDASCNGPRGQSETKHWDFSLPDNQPGLGEENWTYMRSLPAAKK